MVATPYIEAVIDACNAQPPGLASLIVFGSAVTGGWLQGISDVDLILVVPDAASRQHRRCLQAAVERTQQLHGLDHAAPHGALVRFVETVTASIHPVFVCTRADLLSGDIGRILDLPRWQAACVDRGVLGHIVSSGMTAFGEELLPHVPVAPIRRLDVWKAFFSLFNQAAVCLAVYPLFPRATKYAMGVLKRSVHNCFYCYQRRRSSLDDEVRFLQERLGPSRTLTQMLQLRRNYRKSLPFVLACLPALVRLHWRTARDLP
jgi:Nucleotidyltransferase domain